MTELETVAVELDALIADETVRDRHIRLVRIRSLVELAMVNVDNPAPHGGLDNLITVQAADGE